MRQRNVPESRRAPPRRARPAGHGSPRAARRRHRRGRAGVERLARDGSPAGARRDHPRADRRRRPDRAVRVARDPPSAADIDVVGEAEDGERAAAAAAALRPDVVLMDVRMPGGDGMTATARSPTRPIRRVIILTTFDNDEALHGSLRAGASGFLLKRTSFEHIVQAVRTVHGGEALLSPVCDPPRARRLRRPARARRRGAPRLLTDREREVLDAGRPRRVERRDRGGHVPRRADGQDAPEAGATRSSASATARRPSCSRTRRASSSRGALAARSPRTPMSRDVA